MLFYGVVSARPKVVEFFLERDAAEAMIREVCEDKPVLAEDLRVEGDRARPGRVVGWVCGSASGDPPGQTPGKTHSDQSTFRAWQATGVIVAIDPATGLPIFDYDNPAIKFSSFTVVPVETGTPSNPGAINCVQGIFATIT